MLIKNKFLYINKNYKDGVKVKKTVAGTISPYFSKGAVLYLNLSVWFMNIITMLLLII